MKPAPGNRATALHLVAVSLLAAPLMAQEACPRASGPDAEAGWAAYASNDVDGARNAGLARFAKSTSEYRSVAFSLGSSWVF